LKQKKKNFKKDDKKDNKRVLSKYGDIRLKRSPKLITGLNKEREREKERDLEKDNEKEKELIFQKNSDYLDKLNLKIDEYRSPIKKIEKKMKSYLSNDKLLSSGSGIKRPELLRKVVFTGDVKDDIIDRDNIINNNIKQYNKDFIKDHKDNIFPIFEKKRKSNYKNVNSVNFFERDHMNMYMNSNRSIHNNNNNNNNNNISAMNKEFENSSIKKKINFDDVSGTIKEYNVPSPEREQIENKPRKKKSSNKSKLKYSVTQNNKPDEENNNAIKLESINLEDNNKGNIN